MQIRAYSDIVDSIALEVFLNSKENNCAIFNQFKSEIVSNSVDIYLRKDSEVIRVLNL